MDKWVLVTEKLPTKEGLYIVTMDGEIAGQKEPFASTNYFENGVQNVSKRTGARECSSHVGRVRLTRDGKLAVREWRSIRNR